ncbi:MAG: multidrug ABC transporter ATP-binding protein [Thaumarchaeota archaeon]|nr:multidrug ABC transporter ATP-binding protein [Nitrososphaerota archaeon]
MKSVFARSLFKSYDGINAVDGIDLDVDEGQIFGFLGPNGAGKSTVIKLLTTLIQPTSGKISVLEIDAVKEPLSIRKKIGVVLQQPSYEPTLTVEKSLEKYGMMWNIEKKTRMNRMEELLSAFNLVDIRKKRNEDLSIGQRRRVQVAREFMHDMDLLFLDEPTVGLDPTARRQLLDFLKSKVKEKNLTIFYTTHVLTEAEYFCDNIAIINKGKIITVDSPNGLKKRFGHEKTIEIHVSSNTSTLESILKNIKDCKIEFNTGATITIRSTDSEFVLMNVLKILNQNNIVIDDLSAMPTNLEDIFLKVVSDSNASDN